MKTVAVARLKTRLSQYLRDVRKGEEVVITSHSQPLARIVPMAPREGLAIRRATKKWSDLKDFRGVKPLRPFDPVADLLADRARR